jgi:hypothetical protein
MNLLLTDSRIFSTHDPNTRWKLQEISILMRIKNARHKFPFLNKLLMSKYRISHLNCILIFFIKGTKIGIDCKPFFKRAIKRNK